ncbi:MAG: hypothetical protein M1598_09325 [Actinobacteria bacterium]|nr:hypothetical protein [Actinomycetota bacterium]
MKRWIVAILSVLVALAVGWWVLSGTLHVRINPADVKEVRLWGNSIGHQGRPATTEEKAQIIRRFNQGTHPRDNSALAGTTPDAGIQFTFQNGSTLSILRSGTDFEVQDHRAMKARYYWLRQPEIRQLLDELAKSE